MQRRAFLANAVALAAAPASAQISRRAGTRLKLALNSYSFNTPLMAGTMKLEQVIDYCAANNIDGADLTGYYFPGYPAVPSDEYLYRLKRQAYLNGVTISGTGVRNDFASPDAAARGRDIAMVKDWIEAGRKLGAGFIRVFSGTAVPKGFTFDQVLEWMVPAFQECAACGRDHGVIVALQHHDDFLKTSDQVIRVVKAVASDWFSVVLDVGSLRQGDPYEEIARLVPYACTWQIKETVWYGTKAVPIDLPRLRGIIEKSGYRGFLPFEALGRGEPAVVTAFLEKVRKAMI
jgi:sugar phosphate isomerase/epimerase